MQILYIGEGNGTSWHRYCALERLGYHVELVNPRDALSSSRLAESWIWRTGGLGMQGIVCRHILRTIRRQQYDACIVNHGELIGPAVLSALRRKCTVIINYNSDNPFATRDRKRWRVYLTAMPLYDQIAIQRAAPEDHVSVRLSHKIMWCMPSADEIVHRPRRYDVADERFFSSDVAFVGTWMPERGGLIAYLLEAGIRVRVFGAHWGKAPEYPRIKSAVAHCDFLDDEKYVRAIQYSKIAIGLISEGNYDQATKRSVEIPAIGTALLAKRTPQHLSMYEDGSEAVFWRDNDECARYCHALLENQERLKLIAKAGNVRQQASQNWNEIIMHRLIAKSIANISNGNSADVQ